MDPSPGADLAFVLLLVAILLLCAKIGGLAAVRAGQAAVLGELVVGIVLGNLASAFFTTGAATLARDPTIHALAEIGVLILLFDVGLESDVRALARTGPASFLVAVVGVIVPLALGWAVAAWLLPGLTRLGHVFIGACLTATSVGITSRVLRDLGVLQSAEGQTILGAALLDDVFGLILLAVVTGSVATAAPGTPFAWTAVLAIVLKAALFLAGAGIAGHFLSAPIAGLIRRTGEPAIKLTFGLTLCLTLAFVATRLGLAGIIGAFAAGIVLDPYGIGVRTQADQQTLNELLQSLGTVLIPLFFVLMGTQVELGTFLEGNAAALGVACVVAGVAGKLVAGFAVIGSGVNRLAIGIGMVPRGEVGLIFAGVGARLSLAGEPLLTADVFPALILMVLVTTLVTPPALAWTFRSQSSSRRRNAPDTLL